MTTLALSKIASFTRGTLATYFTAAGVMLACDHNLLAWSEDFTRAQWSSNNTSFAASAFVSPSGTVMQKMIENTANATHSLRAVNVNVTAGAPYTASIYVKAAERPRLVLQWLSSDKFGINTQAIFDLTTGQVTNTSGGATGTITSVGNGIYRVTMTATASVSGTTTLFAVICQSDNTASYAGDGASGLYISNPQLNAWVSATNYVATQDSPGYQPRIDYDPSTLTKRGLLVEEQRTNLLNNSLFASGWSVNGSPTITQNVGPSPDGANNATQINSAIAGTGYYRASAATVTQGSVYTQSVFFQLVTAGTSSSMVRFGWDTGNATVNFDLVAKTFSSIGTNIVASGYQQLPNGWMRVWASCTAPSTTPSFVVYGGSNGVVFNAYGAQLEQGSFPTSYIPTYGASTTRAADQMRITSTSPWWNPQAGTVYTEYQLLSIGTAGNPVSEAFDPNNTGSRLSLYNAASGKMTVEYGAAAVLSASSVNIVAAGVLQKAAAAFDATGASVVLNGAALAATGAQVPTMLGGTFVLGGNRNASALNGWLRKLQYYPTRLPNAQLQSMTT